MPAYRVNPIAASRMIDQGTYLILQWSITQDNQMVLREWLQKLVDPP
jgi:hypothetical protein